MYSFTKYGVGPLVALVIAVFQTEVYGVTVDFIDPCQDRALYQDSRPFEPGKSLGSYTVDALEQGGIPYVGSQAGINSIFETPIGDDAIEVLSPSSLRAYGWCYDIDGISPATMPNDFIVSDETSHIRWYFGFALYEMGNWVSYCTPSYEVIPDFICNEQSGHQN